MVDHSREFPSRHSGPLSTLTNFSSSAFSVLEEDSPAQNKLPDQSQQHHQNSSGPAHLHSTLAVFSIEQAALSLLSSSNSAGNGINENSLAAKQACRLLRAAIEQKRYVDKSMVRWMDLLAVVALRSGQKDTLEWLIKFAESAERPEIRKRARRWSGVEGGWRARWDRNAKNAKWQRNQWGGLPM